jgi:PAS domain S-box-containing protein
MGIYPKAICMKSILPDDMPNPVIIYDSRWNIYNINASAVSLLGYTKADELIGKPFKDLLHESEHGVTDAFFEELENKNCLTRKSGICVKMESG